MVMGKDPCLCLSLNTPGFPCMVAAWEVDTAEEWEVEWAEVMACPKGPQCMAEEWGVDSVVDSVVA